MEAHRSSFGCCMAYLYEQKRNSAQKMEHFFTNATVENRNDSLEIGRLSEAFLDQMLECDLTEEIDKTRISDWQEWTGSWR